MYELTDEKVAELKAEHGDGKLHRLDLDQPAQGIVFKRPSLALYSATIDKLTDDEQSKARCLRDLVEGCVVFPEGKDLQAFIKEYPGAIGTIGRTIQQAAGMDAKKKATPL